ncbi:MAG TPA: NAD-dependent epimerase/dehydratase family protein [Acidimicrobiales bacterium]|nr:NAD-dependent epimerase/dehydratase family protein [Acidimicrobiales bacterium]
MDGTGGDPVKPVAVLGATGAIGGRFVEVVAGDGRAPVRALVHRWWHTGRIARFPIELCSAPTLTADTQIDDLAAVLDGAGAAVSLVDGPDLGPEAGTALVGGCARAGIHRLVHVGCATATGRRRAFEDALLAAGDESGVEVAVVAAGLVYGPFTQAGAHEPLDLVRRGRVAVGAGSAPCPLVYVDDLVEAAWAAAAREERTHGRFLALGPAPVTWVDLYEAFGDIVDRAGAAVLPDDELAALAASDPADLAELRWPPEPSTSQRAVRSLRRRVGLSVEARTPRRRLVVPSPDVLAIRSSPVEPDAVPATALGWSPVVPFEEGMRRTAAYLRWAEPA